MSKLVSVLPGEIIPDEDVKQCNCCGEWKLNTFEFYPSSGSRVSAKKGQYLKNTCKFCVKKNNKIKEGAKRIYANKKPTNENYKCPIENVTMQDISRKYTNNRGWSLDHDHTIDDPKLSFRGYISDNANQLLARADDSILTLIRAIIYLIKHRLRVKFK